MRRAAASVLHPAETPRQLRACCRRSRVESSYRPAAARTRPRNRRRASMRRRASGRTGTGLSHVGKAIRAACGFTIRGHRSKYPLRRLALMRQPVRTDARAEVAFSFQRHRSGRAREGLVRDLEDDGSVVGGVELGINLREAPEAEVEVDRVRVVVDALVVRSIPPSWRIRKKLIARRSITGTTPAVCAARAGERSSASMWETLFSLLEQTSTSSG